MSWKQLVLGQTIAVFLCLAIMNFGVAASPLDSLSSGECDISLSDKVTTPCVSNPYTAVGPTLSAGPYTANATAARSIAGSIANTAIDAWNTCRYIDNHGDDSLFMFFASNDQWDTWLNNLPPNIVAIPCAVPTRDVVTVIPSGNCISPNPLSYTLDVPYYGRPSTQIVSAPVTFTCTTAGLCGNGSPACGAPQTWTETATVTYTAASQADDRGIVNWSTSVTYSGTPPLANPAPVNGRCGGGHGNCSSGLSAPGTGGTWVCRGLYGGTNSDPCSEVAGTCGSGVYACSTGTPSNKNNVYATYSWVCGGKGGSASTTCYGCAPGYSAQDGSCVQISNGMCGSNPYSCVTGTATKESDRGGTSTWICSSANGGISSNTCASCDSGYVWNGSACVLPVNAVCGSATNTCFVGTPAASMSDTAGGWMCRGINGGAESDCNVCDAGYAWNGKSCVVVANGTCGEIADTCNSGTALYPTSYGPYSTWTCQGSNGGSTSNVCLACNKGYAFDDTDNCVQIANGACGEGVGACVVGQPINIGINSNGNVWSCAGIGGGTTASCSSASSSADGACGNAAYTCASGIPANSRMTNSTTTWVCYSSNGGKNSTQCSVCNAGYAMVDGVCSQP